MQTLKSNIREMILKAARGKFARKGFLKTSMRDIADAAGMGVGNIYNYFAGKDELFQAVVRPVTDWMFTLFEEMLMHNIQRQEIDRIVEEYVRFEIQGWKNIMNIYETEV